MILADKIMKLRKQNGWSQEDLAEKMDVSRQSVSKWESAQSIPDIDKLLKLSQLFGVSTDYLLKDEVEETELVVDSYQPENSRRIELEEANDYIEKNEKASLLTAVGVSLCIFSPAVLIFLAGLENDMKISETIASGIGIVVLLIMVAIAVVLFIIAGTITSPYAFIETEEFSISYGVEGMVEDRMKKNQHVVMIKMCAGIVLCILCALPLIIASLSTENEMIICGMVSLLLFMVAMAVFLFITSGAEKKACRKLLQQGDYTRENKRMNTKLERVGSVYWGLVTAAYLAWSFLTMRWDMTWIVWPVAGVTFGAVVAIAKTVIGIKEA